MKNLLCQFRLFAGAVSILLAGAMPGFAQEWPQFLGPTRNGSAPGSFAATKWPKDGLPPLKWQACVGNSMSSPVVQDGRLYVMGALKPDADAADGVKPDEMWNRAELKSFPEADSAYFRQLPADARPRGGREPFTYRPVIVHAFCFDAETGRQLWATPIADIEAVYHKEGSVIPIAAPLLFEGRAYFLTQAGSLACVAMKNGAVAWKTHMSKLGSTRTYPFSKAGVGGSPFAAEGKVFFAFPTDNDNSTIVAFEPATGNVVWQKSLYTGFRVDLLAASYATIEGKGTVVVPGGNRTYGLDPANGSVRWDFDATKEWPELRVRRPEPPSVVYWADQHPGRIPLVWGDYVINRVYVWGGHREQRTYCLKIENNTPRVVWFKKDLSAWRGHYVVSGDLLVAMDHGHFTSKNPPNTDQITKKEMQVYDTERLQCIEIASGKRLWATDAFTDPKDAVQLSYGDDEPKTLVAGDKVVVLHPQKLGYGVFTRDGVTPQSIGAVATNNSSVLAFSNSNLYFTCETAAARFGATENANLYCLDLR